NAACPTLCDESRPPVQTAFCRARGPFCVYRLEVLSRSAQPGTASTFAVLSIPGCEPGKKVRAFRFFAFPKSEPHSRRSRWHPRLLSGPQPEHPERGTLRATCRPKFPWKIRCKGCGHS